MNQRTRKRGFLLNRRKRPKKPTQKPSNCLRKQQSACFPMHSHPFILSMMCKCSYTVKKEHPNKPVEAPIQPSESPPPQQQPPPRQTNNVKESISSSTTLVTRYDHSRNSEAATTTPSKVSAIKRGKVKRRVTIGSNQTSSGVDASCNVGGIGGGGGGDDEAEWPPFADEDYIVFCFEDGEFQVKMEENTRSQDCSEHGYSDGSPSPRNLKVEEERFYFSPRLQSDGIRSSTRFKNEVEYGEMDRVLEARGRVDEEAECKDMDGITNRCQLDDDQELDMNDDDVEFRDTSIECVNGSADSPGSSQSDWDQTLQLADPDQEIRLSSSSSGAQDGQMSSIEANPESPEDMRDSLLSKKMVDDEESVYLSSESQQGGSQEDDELSKTDEQSGRGSAATSDMSETREEEEQLEDHEEPARISAVSSNSSEESLRISSSSFEFPALQWQWIGSPDMWPKPESVRFRKQKPRKVCLRLCRF